MAVQRPDNVTLASYFGAKLMKIRVNRDVIVYGNGEEKTTEKKKKKGRHQVYFMSIPHFYRGDDAPDFITSVFQRD